MLSTWALALAAKVPIKERRRHETEKERRHVKTEDEMGQCVCKPRDAGHHQGLGGGRKQAPPQPSVGLGPPTP